VSRSRKLRDGKLIADLRAALAASQVHVDGLTQEVVCRRTPDQIDRIVEVAVDAALGEVARQQAGIADPIGLEARGAGLRGATHLYRPGRSHGDAA
jgi:hypothetical protein